MKLEIKAPSPGESINEVEIAVWLVKNGDYIEKNQPIAELDSDKATLELTAEESGIITLKALEGEVVLVGQVICLIDTNAKKINVCSDSLKNKQEENQLPIKNLNKEDKITLLSEERTYATQTPSPASRKIIQEQNLNIDSIKGTGKDGRIIKENVVNAKSSMGTLPIFGKRTQYITKFSALRKKISQRLVFVKNETAMLTTFNEVDMNKVFKLRKKYKDLFNEKHKVNLGFMSFFTKAVVRGLQLYPDVNSMIDGDSKISNDFQDISIAVSGPKGLMVPVIRNAENLTFRGIEETIKNLAIKVREGKISVDEMTGGTFTISNGGTFGSMLSTPILNPPQSGILGIHNIVERAVVYEGKIVIRPMMYIALSYDHRIIDGKESIGFLVAIKEAIENPVEILMDNNSKQALEL